jgi:hypothetical protein
MGRRISSTNQLAVGEQGTRAAEAQHGGTADVAGLDLGPGEGVLGEVADDLGDEQLDTSAATGEDGGAGLRDGAGEGLLADDVAASGGGGEDHLGVEVGGGADIDDVDVGEQGGDGGIDAQAVLLGERGRLGRWRRRSRSGAGSDSGGA